MPRREPPTPYASAEYHRWRSSRLDGGGGALLIATKPGLIAHGRDDVASRLLAARVVIPVNATVVSLQCGTGLVGADAARRGAAHVYCTDRSIVAVEATRRTLELNAITNASVHAGHGAIPLPEGIAADIVAFRIPTEKLALLQLLADAFALLRVGGQCCIAGATNEGIKSAAGLLRDLFGNATVLGTESGHRAVMAVKRAPTPSDTTILAHAYLRHDAFHLVEAALAGHAIQYFTRPGVFSMEHLDEATATLADVMTVLPGDDVLDLGCGSGPLGLVAARLNGAGRVTFADIDSEAVRCVARAIEASDLAGRVDVVQSDVASALLDRRFDRVVCNPPFHVGKATDLDVPRQFIADAWQVLRPGGSLQLVANRTLPYERVIDETFGNLTTVVDRPRFKVLSARREST